MASTWAATVCLHDPPNRLDRVQSAAFQKDQAHARAFLNWEVDFHRECCISDFQAAVTGQPTNGHAHTHVILEAPSTHHHPLWSAAVDMEKDARGKKTKRPLYSRRTTSTAFQLAVDHAVHARKCVREDRVAEGVPAPRGKGFEIRSLGGNSPMYSNTLSRGKTKVFKYKR
jgi:hypothetical protein